MRAGLFEMLPTNYSIKIIYIKYVYMYKEDLTLNNQEVFICYKSNPPTNHLSIPVWSSFSLNQILNQKTLPHFM